MMGTIIFATIVAGFSSFMWACVWMSVEMKKLDIQERAIEDARKLQDKIDEVQNMTAGKMVSDYIRNITEE